MSTIQRITEHIIVNNTDEHFSNKMFKSELLINLLMSLGVKVSSEKKCERMDRWDASRAMFWTALRSGFVYHLALFAFEEIRICILWVRSVWRKKNQQLLEDQKDTAITLRTVSSKTVKNAIICIAAMMAEALGASVGTLISPGYGTLICDRLFSNCAYLLYDCLFFLEVVKTTRR